MSTCVACGHEMSRRTQASICRGCRRLRAAQREYERIQQEEEQAEIELATDALMRRLGRGA